MKHLLNTAMSLLEQTEGQPTAKSITGDNDRMTAWLTWADIFAVNQLFQGTHYEVTKADGYTCNATLKVDRTFALGYLCIRLEILHCDAHKDLEGATINFMTMTDR